MRTPRLNRDDRAKFAGPPSAAVGKGRITPNTSFKSEEIPTHISVRRELVAVALLLLAGGLVAVIVTQTPGLVGPLLGITASLVFLGVASGGHEEKRIKAGRLYRSGTGITVFTLSLDDDKVALDPGKTWQQVDHFKWVVRGLIEAPQSFHVSPDGSLEINAEKITTIDPDGTTKLENQINKHHTPIGGHLSVATGAPPHPAPASTEPGPPRFTAKLDHLGHMVIEWGRGIERDRTGLRGLATLAANGLIRKPRDLHVDPLQRGVQIDGEWFECSDSGAKRLEEALNTRYAVTERANRAVAIEIKENHAASTGFDIHFTIHRAGFPVEIKGHLSQEYLDILQDPARCELMQPEIHLLISPPYLLFRRQRPDMGEEKIPELPDLNLLRTSAAELQQVLNHPLIRRGGGDAGTPAAVAAAAEPEELAVLRLVKHPADKGLLWIEEVSASGKTHATKAFTHHNIGELQHKGVFNACLDVNLALDNRRLSILNRQTGHEEELDLDPKSSDEDLHRASMMLTQALKKLAPKVTPKQPGPVRIDLSAQATSKTAAKTAAAPESKATATPATTPTSPPTTPPSAPVAKTEMPPTATPSLPRSAVPSVPNPYSELFRETDAVRINLEIFRHLAPWLGIAVQDVRLSLPRVFENRRFEVLSFDQQAVGSLMDLRGEDFYGFYLSHVSDKKIMLVYACNGTHIEWGPDKCVLQPTARSEVEEYSGSALLGLAQDRKNEFVFIVRPPFKAWIQPREAPYTVENVRFLKVADIAASPDEYRLIWPQSPTTAT